MTVVEVRRKSKRHSGRDDQTVQARDPLVRIDEKPAPVEGDDFDIEGCRRSASGTGGSRSCDPVHAMPPRNRTTRAGMDQMIISIRPEYSQSGRYRAGCFWLETTRRTPG